MHMQMEALGSADAHRAKILKEIKERREELKLLDEMLG